jgi:hypothetical protein
LATALACAILLQACGGFTVTPTSPTDAASSGGQPITFAFRGALADGGAFEGTLTYGANDRDPRAGFGRFTVGTWNVRVTGGRQTRDVIFSDGSGGRAAVETYAAPSPTIGLVFLWPEMDPTQRELSPHFRAVPGYAPDMQPTLRDLGDLLPGSLTAGFGVFRDGEGGQTVVTSVQFPLASLRFGLRPTAADRRPFRATTE